MGFTVVSGCGVYSSRRMCSGSTSMWLWQLLFGVAVIGGVVVVESIAVEVGCVVVDIDA